MDDIVNSSAWMWLVGVEKRDESVILAPILLNAGI
jgi:hypothetical protein